MSENIRVVVTGVSGRMGQMILAGVRSNTKTRLVGAIEREGHDWIGKDVGMVSDSTNLGIEVSADPASVFKDADAIIDFSAPKASVQFSILAAELGIVHVIGTTGFSDHELVSIGNSGKKAKIIRVVSINRTKDIKKSVLNCQILSVPVFSQHLRDSVCEVFCRGTNPTQRFDGVATHIATRVVQQVPHNTA